MHYHLDKLNIPLVFVIIKRVTHTVDSLMGAIKIIRKCISVAVMFLLPCLHSYTKTPVLKFT